MVLNEIYKSLQEGCIYGVTYSDLRFPCFYPALYLTPGGYIGYTHSGSSAMENTLYGLEWVLEKIFKCTPEEFMAKYEKKEGLKNE